MDWLERFTAKLGHWVNNKLDEMNSRDAFNGATDAQIAGDFKTALAGFEALAKQGHARAAALAGGYYVDGKRVKVDGAKALKYFQQAHAGGDPEAEALLGMIYASGMPGVKQDFVKARPLLERAASKGDAKAIEMLNIVKRKQKS